MKKISLMFSMAFIMVLFMYGSTFEFVNDVAMLKKIQGKWNVEGISVEFTSQLVSTTKSANFYRFKENNSSDLVYMVMKEKKDSTSFLGVGRLVNGEIAQASNTFYDHPASYSIHWFGDDNVVFYNHMSDAPGVLKATRIKIFQAPAYVKRTDVEEFISLTGQPFIKDTINSLSDDVRKKYTNIPQKVWREIDIAQEKKIVTLLIPIYGNYFTQSEIREMNAFWKGKAWMRYRQVVMKIGEECQAAGRKFREDTFLSVEKQLKAKGYLK